ncbi:outer membrane transport energization protein ExbB [Nitrosomonas marina]|uniref:Outer membrane transport energization protein ExbB n=2 Tax=Nitrosomonas marina TaxID=917 RepID=A0A1H8HDL9_9PROT|nr:outer membrane transport energization protein ExbB [Nitrosomonas marina]
MSMNMHEYILMSKDLFNAGGYVMLPLIFCALLLWYGLGYRCWALRTPGKKTIHDMLVLYSKQPDQLAKSIVEQAAQRAVLLNAPDRKHLRRILDEAFYDYFKEARKFSVLVKTTVVIAPLLGLLGTVMGMIETFDSLGSMSLFTQSGGIAGGISQALITTQMGLSVAIPGLLLHGFLHKKQQKIERELTQLKELMCTQAATGQTTG